MGRIKLLTGGNASLGTKIDTKQINVTNGTSTSTISPDKISLTKGTSTTTITPSSLTTGNTKVNGTLEVTGKSTLKGALDVGGAISGKSLAVDNNITGNTLSTVKSATIGTTLTVSGASTLNGTLNVKGNTTLGDAATDATKVNGTLEVTGKSTLKGALDVGGASTLTGNVTVKGNLSVAGTLSEGGTALSSKYLAKHSSDVNLGELGWYRITDETDKQLYATLAPVDKPIKLGYASRKFKSVNAETFYENGKVLSYRYAGTPLGAASEVRKYIVIGDRVMTWGRTDAVEPSGEAEVGINVQIKDVTYTGNPIVYVVPQPKKSDARSTIKNLIYYVSPSTIGQHGFTIRYSLSSALSSPGSIEFCWLMVGVGTVAEKPDNNNEDDTDFNLS